MEYRYAGHPEGSVVNIEKFLPERKKGGRASEKKRETQWEGGGDGRDGRGKCARYRVVCIFGKYNRPAWIDRRLDNWPAHVCFCPNLRCEKSPIGARIQLGIYSHNNLRVIAVLDSKYMHTRSVCAMISISEEKRFALRTNRESRFLVVL